MSRIIIKNLPKNTNEDKLRAIFGTKGQITDVQLKYTKEGEFRRFGFIGYQNESDAAEAIKYFDNSRINTTKIQVQECATLGDQNKPKSWSKYASDSSAYQKLHKKEKKKDEEVIEPKKKEDTTKELLKKYKDDPLFDEFLQVHSATKAQEILKSTQENDSDSGKAESDEENDNGDEEDNEEQEKVANTNISDEDYLNALKTKTPRKKMEKKPKVKVDLFTLKLTNLPYNCKKKDIKDFLRPVVPFSIRIPRHIKGIAFIGFKDEKKYAKALQKNKSIINGKQILILKYEKKDAGNESNVQNSKWQSQEEKLKNEEGIAESGRIFLRNLSYSTQEEDIQAMFEKFGPIAELTLPVDTTTRIKKGFGVITFVMPEHAVKAYSELDGKILHGRMLHLLPGKPKDDNEDDNEDSSNFKQKKAKQQKSQASSTHNWNSLFLGHDAVADVIANTYNTSKEAVLAPHGSGSAAVRLALGETQIIAETRKYLESHDVYLDAFNTTNVKRSKTTILIKNLPANTRPMEIKDKFDEHGVIGRFIFPPNGITAIVEFIEPSEARKAFSKLAYTKFKNLPLYLEWAPENALKERTLGPSNKNKNNQENVETESSVDAKTKDSEQKQKPVEDKTNVNENEDDDEEPEPDTTIFVKNLDFRTTDRELKEHFKFCGKINYANVATKKDPADPSNTLSMGYGFVRFYHKSSADDAMKTLQHSNLGGKSLELKRSERTLPGEVQVNRKSNKVTKQTGTKILIRNIPFQANRNEVLELFKTFGEIKALRLPKKMTPGADSHRGFAFVDFGTNTDAKKAFDALSQSTHLYGRRLVLEWAQKEEGVAELRKRTADHFHEKEVVKSKKSVFDIE